MIEIYTKKLWPYSGVIAVLILWFGTLFSMAQTGLGLLDDRPLSYLGVDPASRLVFTASLITSAFLLIAFAYYVRAVFGVTNKFLKYFVVGQVCQIILAVSPYGERSVSGVIHLVAALTLAFSLPLLIKQFTASQKASPDAQLYTKLLRLEQVSFIVGMSLFVFSRGLAPLGEVMPAVGFHIWICVVTFRARTIPKSLSSPST